MTFGEIKSVIEKNLLESYKDEKEFKKLLKEFKYYILNNKKMSKLYSLYDQLSTPQGLNEQDAKEFLNEGIELIQKNLKGLKLPMTEGKVENKYKDIDLLVYSVKTDIRERIESKDNILSTLISEEKKYKNEVSLPIESMVNVANKTINNYLSSLDETTKNEFFELINEETSILEKNYYKIKETTINQLNKMLMKETSSDVKTSISETIGKITSEKFDYLSYFKLKRLSESLV